MYGFYQKNRKRLEADRRVFLEIELEFTSIHTFCNMHAVFFFSENCQFQLKKAGKTGK